ncbi:MBL fold metallo-hydrolase [Sphingomonas sp. PB4P5]|uniref:MBL fold metallo-hydrolase n=1 Tax=Parasphingomonas puruogangriensis TaxID=3096155 RepID=UPI002FCB99A8
MPSSNRLMHIAVGLGVALAAAPLLASPYSDINKAAAAGPIKVDRLRGGVRMLSGSGGNIGVLPGPNGLLMVDAGIAVSQKMIQAALRKISPGRIRLLINTHWHWDHTDGNGWVRRTGATIVADRLALRRLTQTNRVVEWEHTFTPINKPYLPNSVLTGDKTIGFAGETLRIRHYGAGHTDGDMSVYFKKADILQTGDTFWNGQYPFIDYVTGGSIDGAIRAANANLAMAGPNTQIIPGHGPVGNRVQLLAFRNMLVAIRARVAALKVEGKSIDQAVAARPTANFDAKWGRSVISGALFTRLVYRGV